MDWLSAVPDGQAASVIIELSVSGAGGPWLPVADNVPNNGRYQWHIPADSPVSDDSYLRFVVTTSQGKAKAQTRMPFTLRSSEPRLCTPCRQASALHQVLRTLVSGPSSELPKSGSSGQ